jgi:hypothetical protein
MRILFDNGTPRGVATALSRFDVRLNLARPWTRQRFVRRFSFAGSLARLADTRA